MSAKNDQKGKVDLESQIKPRVKIAVFSKLVYSRKW